MKTEQAVRDLALVDSILRRTRARLDAHAFHYVLWGAIVLLWYPLDNWMRLTDRPVFWLFALGGTSLLTGAIGSAWLEFRARRSRRLDDEDPGFSRQVNLVVYGCLAAAVVASSVGTATGAIEGERVPMAWGLAYAVMAYMLGVLYRRDFLLAGVLIFLAVLAAHRTPEYAGFILGPAMGLGLLIPGWRAERDARKATAAS